MYLKKNHIITWAQAQVKKKEKNKPLKSQMLGSGQLFPRELSSQRDRSDANRTARCSSLWTNPQGHPAGSAASASWGGLTLPDLQHHGCQAARSSDLAPWGADHSLHMIRKANHLLFPQYSPLHSPVSTPGWPSIAGPACGGWAAELRTLTRAQGQGPCCIDNRKQVQHLLLAKRFTNKGERNDVWSTVSILRSSYSRSQPKREHLRDHESHGKSVNLKPTSRKGRGNSIFKRIIYEKGKGRKGYGENTCASKHPQEDFSPQKFQKPLH